MALPISDDLSTELFVPPMPVLDLDKPVARFIPLNLSPPPQMPIEQLKLRVLQQAVDGLNPLVDMFHTHLCHLAKEQECFEGSGVVGLPMHCLYTQYMAYFSTCHAIFKCHQQALCNPNVSIPEFILRHPSAPNIVARFWWLDAVAIAIMEEYRSKGLLSENVCEEYQEAQQKDACPALDYAVSLLFCIKNQHSIGHFGPEIIDDLYRLNTAYGQPPAPPTRLPPSLPAPNTAVWRDVLELPVLEHIACEHTLEAMDAFTKDHASIHSALPWAITVAIKQTIRAWENTATVIAAPTADLAEELGLQTDYPLRTLPLQNFVNHCDFFLGLLRFMTTHFRQDWHVGIEHEYRTTKKITTLQSELRTMHTVYAEMMQQMAAFSRQLEFLTPRQS